MNQDINKVLKIMEKSEVKMIAMIDVLLEKIKGEN